MNKDYLKNDICKFTPLFKINYEIKKNILTTCFFKMVNKGYKDFSNYVNGLVDLNDTITKSNLNYKIRLFIDNSIYKDKDLFKKILKLKNVEPVLYSCNNYIIHNDYHIGLFGTMVRFFPFFDFPNNDANIVVSSDIDKTNKNIFRIDIELLKTNIFSSKFFNNIYLFKSGPLYRSNYFNFDMFYKDKLNPYVYALSFVSIKRIDNKVLVNFFKEIDSIPLKREIFSYHYKLYNDLNKKTNSLEEKYNSHGKFIYGIDEYFLNKTLCNYIIDNKMCFVVNTSWDVSVCLYNMFKEREELTNNEIKLINLILKYIYEKINLKFVENENIKIKFDRLDKFIYSKNKDDQETKYKINYLFYKLFLFFRNNKNYKFLYPKNYYKLLVDDEKYFGTYSINFFRAINCSENDTDIIIKQKKFIQKDIDKLKKFYLEESKSSNLV